LCSELCSGFGFILMYDLGVITLIILPVGAIVLLLFFIYPARIRQAFVEDAEYMSDADFVSWCMRRHENRITPGCAVNVRAALAEVLGFPKEFIFPGFRVRFYLQMQDPINYAYDEILERLGWSSCDDRLGKLFIHEVVCLECEKADKGS
jgi:hypothetical protein